MSNLQLFTEPGGDGGGSEGGDDAGAGGNPGNNNNTTMSFDEFLALEGNQSEFDRRVQKAVNTAVTNAQTKWKTLTDDKVSEAEKLAQMTNEEKHPRTPSRGNHPLPPHRRPCPAPASAAAAVGAFQRCSLRLPPFIYQLALLYHTAGKKQRPSVPLQNLRMYGMILARSRKYPINCLFLR